MPLTQAGGIGPVAKGFFAGLIDGDLVQQQTGFIKEQDVVCKLSPKPQTVHWTELGIGDNDACAETDGHPIVTLVLSSDNTYR